MLWVLGPPLVALVVVLVAPLVWVVAVVLLATAVRSPRLSLHQAAAGATGRWAPRGPDLGHGSHGGHGENDSGTEVDQLICWVMLGMDWWFFGRFMDFNFAAENQWHAIDLGLLSAPPAFLTTVDVTAYKPRNLNLNSSQRWDLKALNLQKLQFQGIGLKTLQLNEMSEMHMVYAICAAVSKVE